MSTADREARFLEQLEAHKAIVYKVASSFCANAADRQELTQEIAIALWHALPRFDGRSKPSTFVYRVALNVAVSFVREQGRRTRHAVALDEAVLDVAADSTGEEERRAVAELLAGLDELDRALVVLYLEGHTHEVIGEILGISPGNVAVKINRIKARLRDDARSQGG
jgi:RNA polymerase sigma-70 factor (ECF subfamily)